MKFEYQITGLDCANCAANLARLIRRIEGVTDADIDFMRGKLWVEADAMTPERYAKMEMLAEGFDNAVLSPWKSAVGESRGGSTGLNQSHAAPAEGESRGGSAGLNQSYAAPAEGENGGGNAAPANSAHAPNIHAPEYASSHAHDHSHKPAHEHSHAAPQTEQETRFFVKKELLRIGLSLFFFLAAVLLPTAVSTPFAATLSLYLVAYVIVAYPSIFTAAKNVVRGRIFDENFLMVVATVGAFCLKEYAEGVFVMLFYTVGELFQTLAVGRSRKSITQMLALKVSFARVRRGEEWVEIPPEEVAVGDLFSVRPGEKIALDGVVASGATSLDTSAITGESRVREVLAGESVFSGSINLSAPIEVCATHRYEDGTVGKILHLIETASEKKAKTEKFITRFAAWYTPLVVFLAVVVGLIVPIFAGDFALWVQKALVFLVVSCPCALVLSVPLSFFVGMGKLAKCGVLIKGGNYVEALAKADLLFTDKTGTVTDGNLAVSEVLAPKGDRENVLTLAALAESKSNHPVARAIVAAVSAPLNFSRLNSVEEFAGYGIVAEIDGDRVLCGGKRMMERFSVHTPPLNGDGTLVCVAKNGEFLGAIFLRDCLKKGVSQTLQTLKAQGVRRTVMLTGDEPALAQRVAKEAGIDECIAGLLPDEKVAALSAHKTERGTIYVGDGINDAPVLVAATVGVAMGALGSDVAVQTADVVIMDDDFAKLPLARKIARKTVRVVKQNVAFSIVVKVAVMALSVAGLSNMWLAIFADVGVMVLAVLNALRAGK